jgi:hypothetical protein
MSRRLNALTHEGASRPPAGERLEAGTVTQATEPGAELLVELDSLPEQTVTVQGWAARAAGVAKGDRCLVARIETGDYWFVTWDIPGWT